MKAGSTPKFKSRLGYFLSIFFFLVTFSNDSFFILYVLVLYLHECLCKGVRSLRTGVTGSCEICCMGAGN